MSPLFARRFMDSARSHLKDYIWEDCNERGIFFHRSATAPILATLYDIVHPGRFLSPQGDGGKGKFQLLFDDDASPTRAVALFYRRLPIEILIEIRETRRKTLPKSLKRNLSRLGSGSWRVRYSKNVPSGSSTIADLYESNDVLLGIRKWNSLRRGKQWYLVHRLKGYTRCPESVTNEKG